MPANVLLLALGTARAGRLQPSIEVAFRKRAVLVWQWQAVQRSVQDLPLLRLALDAALVDVTAGAIEPPHGEMALIGFTHRFDASEDSVLVRHPTTSFFNPEESSTNLGQKGHYNAKLLTHINNCVYMSISHPINFRRPCQPNR
jgi:hypothetical protein